jgi:hypothetical protein
MANETCQGEPLSIVLRAADWLPKREWDAARALDKKEYLTRAAEIAVHYKNNMSLRGVDVRGENFRPINPAYRRDKAAGKPLDPHFADSRVVKLLRGTGNVRKGTIVLWWSHGWGKIMGFHAYRHGPRSLPVRNAIGFDPATLLKVKNRSIAFWNGLKRAGAAHARTVERIEEPDLPAHRPLVDAPRIKTPGITIEEADPARILHSERGVSFGAEAGRTDRSFGTQKRPTDYRTGHRRVLIDFEDR